MKAVSVQPAWSVPTTWYVVVTDGLAITELPVVALRFVAGDHAYVLAPVAESVAELPKQISGSAEVSTSGGAEALMVKLADAEQLFESVTVTVYVPAARLLTEAVVCTGVVFHE